MISAMTDSSQPSALENDFKKMSLLKINCENIPERKNDSRNALHCDALLSVKSCDETVRNIAKATICDDERLIAAAGLYAPLSNGWTLYEHQKEAVIACIKQKRSILAYDMV